MSAPFRRLPAEWWAPKPISCGATTTNYTFISRGGRLYGWSFEETTGAAVAQLELIDGSSDSGDRIVPITLLANESTRDWLGRPGIQITRGVYLKVVAGSVRATIWYLGLSDEELLELATGSQ